MAFFDKIPENLFSVLSSKNKHIYVECLFIIFKAYREEVLLRKDDIVERLKSFLEVSNFSPEGEEEELPEENNLSSIAHFILRKLEKTGWIYRDYAENFFEELVYLHDYSIKILNTLYELQNQEVKDYNSFVHSAYNNLKNQDVERSEDAIFALMEAHKKTRELIDELKSLLNNLRKYHQMLYEKEEVREILKEHFDEFKELIDDRIYHPLKTFDSIPRYKTPIINILNSWLTDREMMDLLVRSSLKRRIYKDEGEAISKITGMINDILEIYYKIDLLLYEIDKKRASYTRASVERMQYLLNADLSIKGKIVEILKALPERENIYEAVNKNINIFLQNYIDENSLYIKKPERKIPDDKFIKIPEIGDDASDFEREMDFLKERLKNSFTRQKIYKFFKELLKGKSEIQSKDIIIENDEEFIMLILGVFMHDEKGSFYDVVFEKGSVFINGYKIPQMRIKKKV